MRKLRPTGTSFCRLAAAAEFEHRRLAQARLLVATTLADAADWQRQAYSQLSAYRVSSHADQCPNSAPVTSYEPGSSGGSL